MTADVYLYLLKACKFYYLFFGTLPVTENYKPYFETMMRVLKLFVKILLSIGILLYLGNTVECQEIVENVKDGKDSNWGFDRWDILEGIGFALLIVGMYYWMYKRGSFDGFDFGFGPLGVPQVPPVPQDVVPPAPPVT